MLTGCSGGATGGGRPELHLRRRHGVDAGGGRPQGPRRSWPAPARRRLARRRRLPRQGRRGQRLGLVVPAVPRRGAGPRAGAPGDRGQGRAVRRHRHRRPTSPRRGRTSSGSASPTRASTSDGGRLLLALRGTLPPSAKPSHAGARPRRPGRRARPRQVDASDPAPVSSTDALAREGRRTRSSRHRHGRLAAAGRCRWRRSPGWCRSSRPACCRSCPATCPTSTGLSAAEVFDDAGRRRGRLVARRAAVRAASPPCSSAPACCSAASAASCWSTSDVLQRVLGVVTIVLGLAFLGVRAVAAARRPHPPPARRRPGRGAAARRRVRARLDAVPRPDARRGAAPSASTRAPRCAAASSPSPTASASGCRSCSPRSRSAGRWRRSAGVKRHYVAVMRIGGGAARRRRRAAGHRRLGQLDRVQLQVWVNGFTSAV